MNSALTRISAVSIRAHISSMRLCIDHDRYSVFSSRVLPEKDSLFMEILCAFPVFSSCGLKEKDSLFMEMFCALHVFSSRGLPVENFMFCTLFGASTYSYKRLLLIYNLLDSVFLFT